MDMHGVHVGMQGFHAYVLQGPHAQEQNGGSLRVPGTEGCHFRYKYIHLFGAKSERQGGRQSERQVGEKQETRIESCGPASGKSLRHRHATLRK